MPLEVLDAGDAGELRAVERARGHHDEAGPDVVAAVGGDPPAVDLVVPDQIAHLGGEDGAVVQPEVLSDVAAVLIDLGAVGELLARDEVELLEQRYVAVGFVVALNARVAVPVPDAAEVAAHLDDPDVVDACLLQVRGAQQSAEAAAEHGDVDVLVDRIAFGVRGCAGRSRRIRRTRHRSRRTAWNPRCAAASRARGCTSRAAPGCRRRRVSGWGRTSRTAVMPAPPPAARPRAAARPSRGRRAAPRGRTA